MPVYTDAATVKAEPDVADDAATATVNAAIAAAEEWIDGRLEHLPIYETGPSAGLRVAEADVRPWQWDKLGRAATRLAARLLATPTLLEPVKAGTTKGPHFEVTIPVTQAPLVRRMPDVTGPLRAASLIPLTARAAPGPPPYVV